MFFSFLGNQTEVSYSWLLFRHNRARVWPGKDVKDDCKCINVIYASGGV